MNKRLAGSGREGSERDGEPVRLRRGVPERTQASALTGILVDKDGVVTQIAQREIGKVDFPCCGWGN